jgi:hypothetical protein
VSANAGEPFEPARYLSRVNGSDYLEVKWRLVWLRTMHPDAAIETELIAHDDGVAIFRARVAIPRGGSATGYGSETAGDFRDYLEKAETKAMGRALAALGFGTQFCADHETRDEVADEDPAPEGQLRYLESVAQKAGLSDEALDEQAQALFGVPVHALSRRDASHLAQIIRGQKADSTQQPLTNAPTGLSRSRRLAAVPDGVRAMNP